MKTLITLGLILFAIPGRATPIKMNIEGGGQIRLGHFYDEGRFLSFESEVEREILKRSNVEFVELESAQVIVKYRHAIIQTTFYSLFPKGIVSFDIIKITSPEIKSLRFDCPFAVNDGGNVTLKKNCARVLAKKIISNL